MVQSRLHPGVPFCCFGSTLLQLLASGFTLLLGDRETNYFSHKSALYFLSQSKGVSALNWFLFSKIDVEFLDKQLPTLLYFAEH